MEMKMTNQENEPVSAIIVAAGGSKRMGGKDKIFADLAGKPVLARVIDVFEKCAAVQDIVVVVSRHNIETASRLVAEQQYIKIAGIYPGGDRRQDSVLAGLAKVTPRGWVVVHDGARPMVTANLIERGLEEAKETGSAVAAVPVTDTIKLAGDDMLVQGTPPRRSLWAVQTPQIFRYSILSDAYRQAKYEVTDDSTLVERAGYQVKLYLGSYDNIKITTPRDLVLAEMLVKKHEQ
jgi:2-C-methyl-D-erythritol 4-phosphate cytidylyltransferase